MMASWKTCEYCGSEMPGAGIDDSQEHCFRCWELFVEEAGPQLDPHQHPRATEYSPAEECNA